MIDLYFFKKRISKNQTQNIKHFGPYSTVISRHYFGNKSPSSQGYGFSMSHVWMWELDYKESWTLKTVVLKTLESPLDCKVIQPVHPKGDQSWVFIGRTDVEAETPILWPPDSKSWLSCIWLLAMPGLPVHHQLPEFTQTHVHQVGDAIQPSHPLCRPLLLPPIFPSIRVFSKESG